MPLEGISQPQIIQINEMIRLRKYDGHAELALPGYRDPVVYQNSEGIFDESNIPDLDYVTGMFRYLEGVGEAYFIEALENGGYIPIGDLTIKPENPPIAIWFDRYRGKGIGMMVMQMAIARLRDLGYEKITGSTVYKWNEASLKMHQRLGFVIVAEDEREYTLEKTL